jgi:hypothetical protein
MVWACARGDGVDVVVGRVLDPPLHPRDDPRRVDGSRRLFRLGAFRIPTAGAIIGVDPWTP